MIVCNGQVLAQANQFDVADVQTIVATIDLDDVRSYRASIPSFGIQAAKKQVPQKNIIHCPNISLTSSTRGGGIKPTTGIPLKYHLAEEECCLGPACWLWDFLRRSGASGFFLPLSGGADSSAVATIVSVMCILVTKAAQDDPQGTVASDLRRICCFEGDWVPKTPQEMAQYMFHTCFMGTENSSIATHSRAQRLADTIGSYHLSIKIDAIVAAIIHVFSTVCGSHKTPRFVSQGGTLTEDLALQNIQARLRMVTAYMLAQLLPWVRNRKGFLLVLGSANVDEGLRGYMTKYDCSSADLNPIGAISKLDLKRMLIWASKTYNYDVLLEIAQAPPTAELRPTDSKTVEDEHTQTDEDDMGMSYDELGQYGRFRKISRCGPVSM